MIIQSPRLYLPQHLNAAAYYDSMSMDGNAGILTDFAAVSSWKDLSGKGNHLTQVTGANQPTYRINVANGSGNSVVFDGSSRYLTSSVNSYAGEQTVMFLGTLDDSTTSRRFLSYGSTGGISVGTPGTAGKAANLTLNTVVEVNSSSNLFSTGFIVFTAVLRNPTGSTWVVDFYKNGILFQSNISAAAPIVSTSNFIIGAFSTSAAFWVGQIVMLSLWQKVLTTWELNEMHYQFLLRGGLSS